MSTALDIAVAEPVIEVIQIADLTILPELQTRARGTQRDVVRQYSEDMKRGDIFPPVTCFREPKGSGSRAPFTYVVNGFHRVAAALAAGLTEISVEVIFGSKRSGLLHAVQADRTVGLRRTTLDKRRSIELLITAFPKMSDRKIGEACGCDNKTVAATKARLAAASEEIPQSAPDDGSEPAAVTPADPCVRLLGKFKALLALVPEQHRGRFGEQVLELLSAPAE